MELFEGLSEAQAEAVATTAAPLAVLAGPGAGKTRVLTRRIARRCRDAEAAPEHTLVLTFSRRAAGELLGRLAALGLPAGPRHGGVTAGTFHAVAWSQLVRHRGDRGLAPLSLLSRPRRVLQAALATALDRPPDPEEVAAFADELGWARAQGATPTTYASVVGRSGRRPVVPADPVVAGWGAYTDAKRRGGLVDFDDLLRVGAELIEGDAEAAAVVRWRYRHVFVDEYQDLNPAHLRLLRAWVGSRADVCLVGDPDQSVYGFNGACADLFDRLSGDWPGVEVVTLDEDFRSSPEIVAVTDSLRPGPSPGARRSRRPPGAIPDLSGFPDEGAEAGAIARALLAHHGPGRGWTHMAVLARTNARLRAVGEALTAGGVPWRIRDARPLADRPSVRAWLDAVPASGPAVDLLATEPPEQEREALTSAVAEYRVFARSGTAGGFRTWLDASGVTGGDAGGVGVDLATFHGAKGLEWAAVWVVGVEEGLVPLSSATSPAAVAEERRLLYVATSRAGEELHVSWAGPTPSRWVTSLAAVTASLAVRPAPDEQRRRLADLRHTVDGQPGAVRQRHAALLAWRAGRARAARVAPEAILPDTALAALAGCRPTNAADLVRAAPTAGRRLGAWAAELLALLADGQPA